MWTARLWALPVLWLAAAAAAAPRVEDFESPAGPGSAQPNLVAGHGRIYLSWLESAKGEAAALRFAAWDGTQWTAPRTVVAGVPFFANWADFPSLLPLQGGALAAHWLQKSGADPYAYEVKVAHSNDGGASWSMAQSPHRDGTLTEHGFVTLVELGAGQFGAVWLDGRKYAAGEGAASHAPNQEMSLMFAGFESGSFGAEQRLDERVCDCCQTAGAAVDGGLVVAYRDRSAEELRDISVVRYHEGVWSAPRPLHGDGWKMPACPVNGPALAAAGQRVAAAWYTGAQDRDRVMLVFSSDGGASFGAPLRIDQGRPAGRVDLVWLEDGRALVCWLERISSTGAELRARRVHPNGSMDPHFKIADMASARASGFPQLARLGREVLIAWTEVEPVTRVRLGRLQP